MPIALRFVSPKPRAREFTKIAAQSSRKSKDEQTVGQSNELAKKHQSILENYLADIRRRVENQKRYPRREKQAAKEGTVRLRFVIHPKGDLLALEITAHSPHQGLNRAALQSIRHAAPFPSFPEGISRESLTLEYSLSFVLE